MRRCALLLMAGLIALGAAACGGPATPTLPPTAVPTTTPTPYPTSTPRPPSLNLVEPGAGATLISPAIVRGDGTIPPGERTVRARVLDGQGKVLGEGTIRFSEFGAAGEQGTFYGLLRFQAPEKAQAGKLALLSQGEGATVLANGEVAVTLRGTQDAPLAGLVIAEPAADATVASPLTIQGEGIVPPERALSARVVDSLGELLGRGSLQFAASATIGQTAPFSGTVVFSLPSLSPLAYVVVEQAGEGNAPPVARDAVEVQIPVSQ